MRKEITAEQIERLPKHAQQHIRMLERRINELEVDVKRFTDNQAESPFYTEGWHGDRNRHYIQSPNNRMTVVYAGVKLSIFLPHKDDGQRLLGIELSYEAEHPARRLSFQEVGIFPRGISTIQLVQMP
jgi:hypothetical protein